MKNLSLEILVILKIEQYETSLIKSEVVFS